MPPLAADAVPMTTSAGITARRPPTGPPAPREIRQARGLLDAAVETAVQRGGCRRRGEGVGSDVSGLRSSGPLTGCF
jgi:hypothetical protein